MQCIVNDREEPGRVGTFFVYRGDMMVGGEAVNVAVVQRGGYCEHIHR
jgi:hypothetical protein